MIGTAMPDIPRSYTAIAEWSACLIFILSLKPRFSTKKTVGISVLVLAALLTFLTATAFVPLWMWVPCMVTAFFGMVGFIYTCANVKWKECVYYAEMAFVIAESAASLEWQIVNFFFSRPQEMSLVSQGICLICVYGCIELILWKLVHDRIAEVGNLDMNWKDWFTALMITIIVFVFSNLSFLMIDTPFSGTYSREIANIRTLADVAGLAMLFAHLVLCCEYKTRRELEAVQNVLQNQYHQYKLSRDSINLLNYKYHDMKHQIMVLRSESDPEKRNEFLNKMEEEIKQYELQNKTGNSVLDTVLTGKNLYCNKHGITLTSVADGKLLDFMDVMDICSIFGNALDNAIESVMKLQDKEKRLIHVTVSRQKNFLMIHVENYFEGTLDYEEGRLRTTKKNKDFHGYGIKSIRYIAEKYNGAVDIDTRDHWFRLGILIPLETDEPFV